MARILVVDDDIYTLKTVEAFLGSLKHDVLLAKDGDEGVQMALQHRPDLIILDVMMPKKDGFQVLDELRRFRRTQSTPVLMLSSLDQPWDREEARRRGATDFLSKPLDRNQLLNRLDIILGRQL
ncbi:MAG: response regulator [Fimbriimonadaceae bacterium]|nr:response regulator [Fimbriimonadaceae bacterium]